MGNQQALTQKRRLARAQLDRELIDGLLEGDIEIVQRHLDENDDVDLDCLADYACELNQTDIFIMVMSYLPEDANVDALFFAAYEKDLVSYHDKEFMQEFLPVVQNRGKMLETIWKKDDLGCFKLIKDDITTEEILLAETKCDIGRGKKIFNYIVKHNVFDSETIKKLQDNNTASGRLDNYKETIGKFAPVVKRISSSFGFKTSDEHVNMMNKGIDLVADFTSAISEIIPDKPIATLDAKIKKAVRKQQKARIRHALRDGVDPKDILNYAHKHNKSEIYCLVAAYMSDEPEYDKHYDLGLRKGWYDPDDVTYQPKYVKPDLLDTLKPMFGALSSMMKTSKEETKIPQKYKTAIRNFQKNRLRHIIRDDENALENMIIYATTHSSTTHVSTRPSLEYLMTLWPPDKDATKILGNICCQFNMFTLNDIILQYLHLPSNKKMLVQQCEISHNNDISFEIIKLCTVEERAEILQMIAKNSNLSLLKRLYDADLISDVHKFLRKNNLKVEELVDTSSILQEKLFKLPGFKS